MPGLINIPSPRAIYKPPVVVTGGTVNYGVTGRDTIDGNFPNDPNACHFTISGTTFTISSVSIYVSSQTVGQDIYFAVYSDDGANSPSTVVYSSPLFEWTDTSTGWKTFSWAPGNLTASTKYWLCCNYNGTTVAHYDSTTASDRGDYDNGYTLGTWPTWTSGGNWFGYSMYLTGTG